LSLCLFPLSLDPKPAQSVLVNRIVRIDVADCHVSGGLAMLRKGNWLIFS
jgi:hypothetical protein